MIRPTWLTPSLASIGSDLVLSLMFAAAVTLGATYWSHRIRVDERTKVTQELVSQWNQKLETLRLQAAGERARQQERYDANIASARARLDRALGELRKRPSRVEQAVAASQACPAVPACTGDRLAREDASFLTRYAALAAEQQAQLKEAREGYYTCTGLLEQATNGKGIRDESSTSPGVPGP